MRRKPVLLALLFASAAFHACVFADFKPGSADKRFLEGLRKRQLFHLAETFCANQIREGMDDVDRADVTIELIRTYAQHAIHLPPSDREPKWKQARDTAEQFLATQPNNPRRLLVRVQDALTLLARGELARQEAEIGRNSEEALGVALVTVREAIRMLERLEKDITAEIPKQTANPNPDALDVDELIALRNNIRYQLARGFRNRALCYPAKSQDRVAALASAAKMLDQISTEIGEGDALLWKVRVDRVVCERLLGDPVRALMRIEGFAGSKPPPDVLARLYAETIRARMALGQSDQLTRTLEGIPKNVESPELSLAHLEAYLALWKSASDAGDETAARRWRDGHAVAAVQSIEKKYNAYWARRANQLLVGRLGNAPAAGNLQIMTRTADNLYLKNQLDEAIAAYEEAAAQAITAGDTDSAFVLLSKPVLIEQKRGNADAMLAKLRSLALRLSTHPQASGRHLSAIKLCVQLARKDAKYLEQYQQLLAEHLSTWPSQPSSDTVRNWLAKTLMAKRQWLQAINVLTEVDPSSVELNQSLQQMDVCYAHLLRDLQSQGQPITEQLGTALRYFESLVLTENRLPARWSAAQRSAALSVAKLHLNYNSPGAARCEAILRAAIDGQPPAPDGWRDQAQAWLVVALASQPNKQAEAQAALQKIGGAQSQDRYKMLLALSDLSASATSTMQTSLANLRLAVAETLLRDGTALQPQQQQNVQFEQADALTSLGRSQEAIAMLERLAKSSPDNARIQERYGDALIASDDKPTLQRALTQWRWVSKKSKPKSERWFKAKHNIALALLKLGDRKRAADVLGVLQLTTDLDATSWGDAIRDLLRRCQS